MVEQLKTEPMNLSTRESIKNLSEVLHLDIHAIEYTQDPNISYAQFDDKNIILVPECYKYLFDNPEVNPFMIESLKALIVLDIKIHNESESIETLLERLELILPYQLEKDVKIETSDTTSFDQERGILYLSESDIKNSFKSLFEFLDSIENLISEPIDPQEPLERV